MSGEPLKLPDQLTLRDWFAGQALTTALQLEKDDAAYFSDRPASPRLIVKRDVVQCAYELADAMLQEREKAR